MTRVCSECFSEEATVLGRCASCQRHLDTEHSPQAISFIDGKMCRIEFCHGAGKNGSQYEKLPPALRRRVSTYLRAAADRLMVGITE